MVVQQLKEQMRTNILIWKKKQEFILVCYVIINRWNKCIWGCILKERKKNVKAIDKTNKNRWRNKKRERKKKVKAN